MSLDWKLWLLVASNLSTPLEHANNYGSDHQLHFYTLDEAYHAQLCFVA